MTVPADQNFDNKTVFEHGSATIDGVTYFANNPYAVLQTFSVAEILPNAGNALAVGGDLLGFKTVDGSAFRLESFTFLNATGECTFQGYRDGVLVASATELFASGLGELSSVTLGSDFSDIDEFRLTDPSDSVIIVDDINFSATHLAPSISGLSGDAAAYAEGAPPVAIDVGADAVISDPDTFLFDGGSLSVAIVANNVAAEDVLGVLSGGGVLLSGPLAVGVTVFVGATAIGTVTADGSHGHPLTFAFNGNATQADVTALLHALTYTNTNPDNPDTGTRTLQTTFLDGDGQSATVSSTVSVADVNDAPVAVASAGSASYTEGAPVAVDAGIVLSDVDSANLASATVKISGNYQSGDVLLFTSQHGITGAFDVPTGTLTLSGSASVADYQTALDSIDFSTGSDPGWLTRTVTFTVNDGALDSAPVTRTIDVTPVNTAPVATIAPSYAATGHVSLNLKNSGLAVSDGDAHSGTETVTLSVGEGTLTVTAGGSGASVLDSGTSSVTISGTLAQINALLSTDLTSTVSYIDTNLVPAASTRLTLAVDDNGNSGTGVALTASANATIFITAVNSAPVLAGVAANVAFAQHGAAVVLSPGLSMSDIDSATLGGATVHIAAGTFAGDGDVLAAVTAGTGITANYNASTETLNLTGTDTLAHYAQVLDTVTFQSTATDATGAGAHPARTVEWQVDDGAAANNHSLVATTIVTVPVIVATTIATPAAHDFNGDGQGDILWRHAGGSVSEWLMNAGQIGDNLGVGSLDAGRHFLDSGDFNGNGHADALWRDDSGQVALWTLNGAQIGASQPVATIGNDWHNQGAGDFNGDGHSDVLWRNDGGQVALWTMNGAQITANQQVANVGHEWHVQGLLDAGGDGKSDVLWRSDSGQVVFWTMNGAQISANQSIANVGLDWHIAGTGDFNGDGRGDVLWHNDSGQVALWTLDGAQIMTNQSVATIGPAWHIDTIGDYNHDGRSDVLLRNDSGQVAIWELNGAQIVANHAVTSHGQAVTIGAEWTTLSHHYDLV